MADLPILMTASEVAKALLTTPATVRRWAADGRLAAIRLPGNRSVRFRRADVEALLAEPTEQTA